MNEFFDGQNDCIEPVLQIILDKPDLKVKEVHAQVTFVNNSKNIVTVQPSAE